MNPHKKENVVGIVGGMGPHATLAFAKLMLEVTPAKKDWEHVHTIIDNNVKIPSRTRAILYKETNPSPYIIESINNLSLIGADFVVVPCNSAHFFYEEVRPYIRVPWLNMIKVVAKKNRYTRPLILGAYVTVTKKLYSRYIKDAVYLTAEENESIYRAIEEIKLHAHLSPHTLKKVNKLIIKYQDTIDAVILACTELPLAINTSIIGTTPIVDANRMYAMATITHAQNS